MERWRTSAVSLGLSEPHFTLNSTLCSMLWCRNDCVPILLVALLVCTVNDQFCQAQVLQDLTMAGGSDLVPSDSLTWKWKDPLVGKESSLPLTSMSVNLRVHFNPTFDDAGGWDPLFSGPEEHHLENHPRRSSDFVNLYKFINFDSKWGADHRGINTCSQFRKKHEETYN